MGADDGAGAQGVLLLTILGLRFWRERERERERERQGERKGERKGK